MLSAAEALTLLQDGNRRFVADDPQCGCFHTGGARRRELVRGQDPFAVILGCSDSRVPAEMVFDVGLGDLFVIRVAGNVVAPSLIGSVEFAATKLGTRLVVVMGHSSCGAVEAALADLQQPSTIESENLCSIVDRIRPAVAPLLGTDAAHDPVALMHEAVRANVRASMAQLHAGSVVLENLIHDDGLRIVGADYSLETGQVTFLDEA